MDQKVSMKDIAKKLGVSIALVSYVLNNREVQARVGKDIAQKIKKTALELKYQPNLIARSLKSGKTKTIGLIVADISNPFFSSLSRIIEDEAGRHGYTVLFGSNDEQASKTQPLIDAFTNRQVDGLIISPAEGDEKNIKQLQKNNIPFVLLDRYFPSIDTSQVRIDNYSAAYEAVEILLQNGYSKIGMLAYNTSLAHMQERIRGYKTALKDAKLKAKNEWLITVKHNASGDEKVKPLTQLLEKENGIDAIFFATNSLAVAALAQIKKSGIRVPEELGVISFDESEAFEFFYVPVSYISQNINKMGKEAVQLLLQNIENGSASKNQLIIETRLVQRASSGKLIES